MNYATQSSRLPTITENHLHKTIVSLGEPPCPDPGGSELNEAVQAFNNRDYRRARVHFESALTIGLSPRFQAMVHYCLGEICLEGEIMNAVDHFLKCLESPERDGDSLWECAVYLASIYAAAGHQQESQTLQSLANSVNSFGMVHTLETEVKIQQLVKELAIR